MNQKLEERKLIGNEYPRIIQEAENSVAAIDRGVIMDDRKVEPCDGGENYGAVYYPCVSRHSGPRIAARNSFMIRAVRPQISWFPYV